jgi:UDP-N-acetylmuramoyl-tripeptide--D-alanyl-D-alanine ligase
VIVYVSYKALFHQPKYDIIVLEYGIDHPGEMDQMISIVAPDIAIWTGIGDTHISQFDNIQHLADEKAKLIMSAKNIVYMCDDNPLCQSYINRVSVDNITFSYHHMHDISAKIHHITQSKL